MVVERIKLSERIEMMEQDSDRASKLIGSGGTSSEIKSISLGSYLSKDPRLSSNTD